MITLADIKKAQESNTGIVRRTPLDFSHTFSAMTNNHVFMKLENLQKTGSFKIRGAYHKIMSLTPAEQAKGVIAASAGNHAQGVAYGATKAGLSSTIVMPTGAPLAKIEATKQYGANVILHGHSFDEALEYAQTMQKESDAIFVHAFDDDHTIAGQGTVGLEIMDQLPDVDVIVCPIGGGGLIAGVAIAAKKLKPSIKIYGVQTEAFPSASNAFKKISTEQTAKATIADGIAVKQPGHKTLEVIQKYVDDILLVNDIAISRTMLYLLERSKLVVEGAGAVALSAVLESNFPIKNKKVAVLISGGNVDINFISKIIERGLVESGRYMTIVTTVPDKPGYLNLLLQIMAKQKANVISIYHHRISSKIMLGQTEIELSLETKNQEHIQQIEQALHDAGHTFSKK